MPLTGAYYPRAACCNTDLALLLCHRQQSEQQAIIRSSQSVRKIGLCIQRCTAAHARCADRLTISTIHAIACSKDAWRTGHRAGTLHHDIPIIVTVHNTSRKISGWRMADSHEYGVGVQRVFFSGHHVTYGNAADTGRCHSRSFDCQARNGNRCTGVLCGGGGAGNGGHHCVGQSG